MSNFKQFIQKKENILPLATLTIFVVIIIIMILVSGAGSSSSKSNTPQDLSSDAWYICQDFIKDKLKAPSTAEFEVRNKNHIIDEGDNTFTITMNVDAENSFGAMIRDTFYCRVHYTTGDQWILYSLTTK